MRSTARWRAGLLFRGPGGAFPRGSHPPLWERPDPARDLYRQLRAGVNESTLSCARPSEPRAGYRPLRTDRGQLNVPTPVLHVPSPVLVVLSKVTPWLSPACGPCAPNLGLMLAPVLCRDSAGFFRAAGSRERA